MESEKERNFSFGDKQDTIEISEDDIRVIDDYDDAFNFADKLGVGLEGLDDLDDMIERLLMHYKKENKNERNPKKQIESVMIHLRNEDDQKRKKLKTLLNETKDTMIIQQQDNTCKKEPTGSTAIEALLQTEGATNNLVLDLNSKINDIASGECSIVVSGETSAGKSTLLNLILEEDILPTHWGSCTSVITKISYGPIRKAVVVYHDQMRPPLKFDRLDKNSTLQQVMDIVFVKDVDDRDQQSEVKEIQLYIPSKILKSGVVFVDTPGVGENDAMDEVITKFVAANQIMGFIYVIKSNSAGGVQEDRLLNLIRIILDNQKQFDDKNLPFDPKCAIFICNLWDAITTDREEVYQNAVNKLKQWWPSLDSSQVLKLSAAKAQKEVDIDPDYIKDDYRECLEGIKDIYQRAIDRRVKSTYKWIENILLRSTHHLKSLVKSIDSSDRDMGDKMKMVNEKLQRLRKRSDGVIEDMKARVKEASNEICEQFREYLKSPTSRVIITNWIEDELPSKNDCNSWENIKNEIDIAISSKVEGELIKWEQEKHIVRQLEEQVVLEIRTQLHLLQDELEDIEETIQEDDETNVQTEEKSPSSYRDSRGRRITLAAFKAPTLHLGPSESTAIPIKMLTRAKHPLKKFMIDFRKSIRMDDLFQSSQLKAYKEKPCKVAKQRADEKLKSLLDPKQSGTLRLFIEALLERPMQYIQSLGDNIPALIKSNEDLINHMASCRVNAVESRVLYEHMMEGMENLRRHLIEYGHGHIFVDDFLGEEITILENMGQSGRKLLVSDILSESSSGDRKNNAKTFHGLWTVLQNGFVVKDGQEKNVSIKIYLISAGLEHTFPEVAKLRCLHDQHIAEFLGIYHSDSPIPALVYQNHVKSLRQFIHSGRCSIREDLPRIMLNITHGIEYLHRKRMVHMELNIDTITVTYEGEVSLTGGCLPRCAAFPIDKEHIEVGNFVYLAPEVLNSELYVACADIYALALLLFELFVDVPFKQQRKWRLDSFISKVNPLEMLELDSNLGEFGESMTNFITQCLQPNPDSRPTTEVFLQNIKDLRKESAILHKTSLKRKSVSAPKQSESCRS